MDFFVMLPQKYLKEGREIRIKGFEGIKKEAIYIQCTKPKQL